MVSLAKSCLIWDWRRYVPVVVALAFSTLLIYAQVGLALGWFINQAAFLQSSSADLLVSAPGLKTYEEAGWLDTKVEFYLRLHPEVVSIQPQCNTWGQIRTGDAEDVYCVIYGIKKLTGGDMLVTPEFTDKFGVALEKPMTVVIEENYSKMLGLKLGDRIEINNKKVTIVGMTPLSTMVKFYGLVLTSMTTMESLSYGKSTQYFLVRLKTPANAPAIGAELMQLSPGKFRAWTKAELFQTSQLHALFKSRKSLQIIFSTILSALIGIVITNQSLRGAILASLREYAAIRALGVSRRSLNLVILEQSLWLGLLGVVAGLLLTYGVALVVKLCHLPFYIPLWLLAVVSGFILTVSVVSGMLAMRALYRTQPAELLR